MMRSDPQCVLERATRLADQEAVAGALDRMAAEISRDLSRQNPVVLAVMVGGLLPAAWLLQRLAFPLTLDYVHATRYQSGTRGSDRIDWIARPRTPLEGRAVLVIDDVLDEGHTLAAILADCQARGARVVRSAVLVEKQLRDRSRALAADYTGLRIENRYLFGCGMDYREHHRQHAAVFALADEDDRE